MVLDRSAERGSASLGLHGVEGGSAHLCPTGDGTHCATAHGRGRSVHHVAVGVACTRGARSGGSLEGGRRRVVGREGA